MIREILLSACLVVMIRNVSIPWCDPGFQNQRPVGTWWKTFASNSNCWFSPSMGTLQSMIQYQNTTCADLYTTRKQFYCQTILLQPGQKYALGYDAYISWAINHVTMLTYINSVIKSEFFIKDSSQQVSHHFKFVAQTVSNRICFTDNHYTDDSMPLSSMNYSGSCLDNITLNSVSIFRVDFQIVSGVMQFELISNFSFQASIVLQMKNRYDIQIADEKQFTGIEYLSDQNGYLLIRVKLLKNMTQATVGFVLNQSYQANIQQEYQINVNGSYQNPQPLAVADSAIQQNVIEEQKIMSKIIPLQIEHFGKFVKYFKNFNQIALCSLVILNFIGFWNISLLYIFLQIDTVPLSVRHIYQRLFEIFSNSSLFIIAQEIFQFSKDQIILQGQDQIRELVPLSVEKYSWFGNYGISSKVVQNNLQTLLILILLTVKILLFKLLIRIILINSDRHFQVSYDFGLIILAEFIAAVPFILISAITCVQNSMETFKELLQKIIQVLLLFCSLFCFVLLIVLSKNNRGDFQAEKSRKKLNKQKKSIGYKDEVIENIHILIVPFLLIFASKQVFFAVVLILIVWRIIYYIKAKQMGRFERIYLFIMNIVWLAHHSGFLAFFILSKLNQGNYFNGEVPYVDKIGYLVILTIIAGASLQLFKILTDLITFIFRIFVKRRRNAVIPQVQQPTRNQYRERGFMLIKDMRCKKNKSLQISKLQF